MIQSRIPVLLLLCTVLAACGSAHKGRTTQFSAQHMVPLISYSIPEGALPSAASIEDILGRDYQMLGDVQDSGLAWKKGKSGLTAIVEYQNGCVKKAMLLDKNGKMLAFESHYKRCEV